MAGAHRIAVHRIVQQWSAKQRLEGTGTQSIAEHGKAEQWLERIARHCSVKQGIGWKAKHRNAEQSRASQWLERTAEQGSAVERKAQHWLDRKAKHRIAPQSNA